MRRSLLQHRRALSEQSWQEKSEQICCHLQTCELFRSAQTVLAYFSTRQEPDLRSLFQSKKRWGFPRCQGQQLIWHRCDPANPMAIRLGAYGIPEPHPELAVISVAEVDLILVPMIACDPRGYRLGYGGGYYDRLLSDPQWQGIPTIGIGFDFARLPHLPIDPWDQPLSTVCTESGFFPVN